MKGNKMNFYTNMYMAERRDDEVKMLNKKGDSSK